jgi:hypothetical protein
MTRGFLLRCGGSTGAISTQAGRLLRAAPLFCGLGPALSRLSPAQTGNSQASRAPASRTPVSPARQLLPPVRSLTDVDEPAPEWDERLEKQRRAAEQAESLNGRGPGGVPDAQTPSGTPRAFSSNAAPTEAAASPDPPAAADTPASTDKDAMTAAAPQSGPPRSAEGVVAAALRREANELPARLDPPGASDEQQRPPVPVEAEPQGSASGRSHGRHVQGAQGSGGGEPGGQHTGSAAAPALDQLRAPMPRTTPQGPSAALAAPAPSLAVPALPCGVVGFGSRAELAARLPASHMLLRHAGEGPGAKPAERELPCCRRLLNSVAVARCRARGGADGPHALRAMRRAECVSLDRAAGHQRVPNHLIPLSEEGVAQVRPRWGGAWGRRGAAGGMGLAWLRGGLTYAARVARRHGGWAARCGLRWRPRGCGSSSSPRPPCAAPRPRGDGRQRAGPALPQPRTAAARHERRSLHARD